MTVALVLCHCLFNVVVMIWWLRLVVVDTVVEAL